MDTIVNVVLVDEEDRQVGLCEKYEAHKQGLLHRAFSIYLFDDKGNTLVQQRAKSKYHSPGLRANTCCSHPLVGEHIEAAAHRRLQEEFGFDAELSAIGEFVYKTTVPPDLVEHEYLHVFFGKYLGQHIKPDTNEIESRKRIATSELDELVNGDDSRIASWTKKTRNYLHANSLLSYT